MATQFAKISCKLRVQGSARAHTQTHAHAQIRSLMHAIECVLCTCLAFTCITTTSGLGVPDEEAREHEHEIATP